MLTMQQKHIVVTQKIKNLSISLQKIIILQKKRPREEEKNKDTTTHLVNN